MSECPCGSGAAFEKCCHPFLAGKREPETAEQMMRARYSAHVQGDIPFLMTTLHPESRAEGDEEAARKWARDSQWLGLEILATHAGSAKDDEGIVEFVARYRDGKGLTHSHRERSSFLKVDGRWRFREGEVPEQATLRRDAAKVGRNDPCPCGSGKKYKKCCEKAA